MIQNFFNGPTLYFLLCGLILTIFFSPETKRIGNAMSNILSAVVGVIILIVVMILDYYLVDFNTASTALEGIFVLVSIFIFSYIRFERNIFETLYRTVWIYITASLLSQIVMPLNSDAISSNKLLPIIIMILGNSIVLVMGSLFAKYISDNHLWISGDKKNHSSQILFSFLILSLFILLSNYQFIFWLLGEEPVSRSKMITVFRLIVAIVCLMLLFLQNYMENSIAIQQDYELMKQLYYQQKDQYELSQKNIELINRKCHDIKHQMNALKKFANAEEIKNQLDELEDAVMIYDSVVKTGNQVLDTVLTEKNLYCEKHHIQMTCMVDGSMLAFIDKVDLYTMFSNALDNAIESVVTQEDKEKRVIQVSVFHEKNLLMIRILNYCDKHLKIVDGIPESTKCDKDFHGFGLKSISYTAEKYGGGLLIQQLDNTFALQVLLPMPAH